MADTMARIVSEPYEQKRQERNLPWGRNSRQPQTEKHDQKGSDEHQPPVQTPRKIEIHLCNDDGDTPNHPNLPLVVMCCTGAEQHMDSAACLQRRFAAHSWGAAWRWTVYPYQHFHSTNHEVLGVSQGTATLLLGGKNGSEYDVNVGDAIVIPAGVGHKRLKASDDFQVVGAYPEGREPDLLRPGDSNLPADRQRILRVPLPRMDPVYGLEGPLLQYWK